MDAALNQVKQADSTILILLVVIAIIAIGSVPFIKTIASIDAAKRKREYQREDRLIQVIEKNTEVNASLKTVIEADKKKCDVCRQEQFGLFNKIFDNQKVTNTKLSEISMKLEKGKGEN